MPPIDGRSLLAESLRIGVLLFIPYSIGAVMKAIVEVPFRGATGTYVREGFVLAGTAIALLYVLLRSVTLARTIDSSGSHLTPAFEEFVREAVVLALPVILWFSIAGLAMVLRLHTTLGAAIDTLVLASTGAGILTAILYLLARGIAVHRSVRFQSGSERPP